MTQDGHLPGRRSRRGPLCQKSAPPLAHDGPRRCQDGSAAKPSPLPSPKPVLPSGTEPPCALRTSLTPFSQRDQLRDAKVSWRLQSPFTGRQQAIAANGLGATPTAPPVTSSPKQDQCTPGYLLPGARHPDMHRLSQRQLTRRGHGLLTTAVGQQACHSPAFCSKGPAPRDPDARVSRGAAHGWDART